MACAFPPRLPTCVPRRRHVGDPRVLNFFDISATIDTLFPTDCSNFGSNSLFGEIFEYKSSKSRCCNDDSMSTSS
jgi:hypothetical protein